MLSGHGSYSMANFFAQEGDFQSYGAPKMSNHSSIKLARLGEGVSWSVKLPSCRGGNRSSEIEQAFDAPMILVRHGLP